MLNIQLAHLHGENNATLSMFFFDLYGFLTLYILVISTLRLLVLMESIIEEVNNYGYFITVDK